MALYCYNTENYIGYVVCVSTNSPIVYILDSNETLQLVVMYVLVQMTIMCRSFFSRDQKKKCRCILIICVLLSFQANLEKKNSQPTYLNSEPLCRGITNQHIFNVGLRYIDGLYKMKSGMYMIQGRIQDFKLGGHT